MRNEIAVAALLACVALAGCGGGMQIGGSELDPISDSLAGDDPNDPGMVINDGVGDVIP